MSEATCRAVIYAVLSGLSDMGVVHNYRRVWADWEEFKSLFTSTIDSDTKVRGWTLGAEGIPTIADPHDFSGREIWEYHHRIRMYWGNEDSQASEVDAIAKVEEVMLALKGSTLHDGGDWHGADSATCEVFELRVFGEVLCHYAEIDQVTREVR